MLQEIALKHTNGIVFNTYNQPAEASIAFVSELMQYGYMPNADLADALSEASAETIASLTNTVIPVLKKSVGAQFKHVPLYANYATEDIKPDNVKTYINNLVELLSNTKVAERPAGYEHVKFKILTRTSYDDIEKVFADILASADSISEGNRKIVEWFINDYKIGDIPKNIPFKENMCLVAGILMAKGSWAEGLVKDTNDVLRIATYLSGGDISLAENTKFKNFPRAQRKTLIYALETVAKEEDFVKHAGKWVKLGHSLHIGDYSKSLYKIFKKLRENIKINTFNGKVDLALNGSDYGTAIKLLKTRPGVFARTLSRLLTEPSVPVYDPDKAAEGFAALQKLKSNLALEPVEIPVADIVSNFVDIVDKVPTRNLLQLWGSLKTRYVDVNKRVIFPKGSVAKAYVLRNTLAKLPIKVLDQLINTIKSSLKTRFADGESLGKVYIDPELSECPLPVGMRSASEGLREVARGTRMHMTDKNILRFFIYWVGQDIDLSASFHDASFKKITDVAYYNLSAGDAHHSGDILNAPNGASEFIDINIKSAIEKQKARYLIMNVHVFSGPTFKEHKECFAGWMSRSNVGSNDIYEPKTVEHKVDLRSESKHSIPVIFDLVNRKAIWADVNSNRSGFGAGFQNGGNVANSKAGIEDMCEAFTSLDNKISLHELFTLHAEARGEITKYPAEADTVFSMDNDIDDNDNATVVTPFDILTINSEFVV